MSRPKRNSRIPGDLNVSKTFRFCVQKPEGERTPTWTPGPPPPNARTVKYHPLSGTVLREEVRAAVQRLKRL